MMFALLGFGLLGSDLSLFLPFGMRRFTLCHHRLDLRNEVFVLQGLTVKRLPYSQKGHFGMVLGLSKITGAFKVELNASTLWDGRDPMETQGRR